MSVVSRFLNQWRRQALDRDFEEELRFHVEQRVDANVRAGMSRGEAEAEARRHLGSPLRATEGMREARISGLIDGTARDLRHGWRVFRRQPGLAALAVITLSLGIGANAAIFSLLDAVLLRPLPFPDAGRLVAVVDGFRATGSQLTSPTIPELLDARASIRSLRSLSFFDTRDFQIDGGSEPMRVLGARVEPSLLPLLGARPALGRLIEAADSEADGTRIVVLSDGLWRRNFGSDPAVVGRQVIVNGQPFRIAGVTAPDFGFDVLVGQQAELFVPYPLVPIYTSRQAEFANVRRVMAIGRLTDGVTIETASAELAAFSRTLAAQYPALYHREADGRALGFFMDAEPLRDRVMGGGEHPVLMLLVGAVGLVLLIACVNTVQFLLAQSVERQSEVAVRSALGAARTRLLRQFLSEALLLAAAAGLLGLLQAVWLTRLLRGVLPEGALVGRTIGVDATVLLFTAGVAVAVALGCGLFPALHLSRISPGRGIETRGAPGRRARSRQLFIAVEVAISVVLLISAGLLLRSIDALRQSPRGYDAGNVSVMRIRGFGASRLGPTYQRYLEQVARVPGIEAAAITSGVLPGSPENPFTIVGWRTDQTAEAEARRWGQSASYQMVSGGYFAVLRIPLQQGRTFASDDVPGRPPVAIINEELARRYFPGRSPLGQLIRSGPGPRAATMTIVGVVGNVRPMFQQTDEPQIYVSVLQQDEPSVALIVRTGEGHPLSVQAVKQAVWSVVPQQAVFGVIAMADLVAGSMADHRVIATLLGSFALLALVMSVTGIYTVVTYLTSRRTKEIALRRAIGARGVDVFALLAGPAFRSTLAGVLAGALGAVAAGSALRAALTGIVPLDALTVVFISALYLLVVAVAMSVPAFRVMRVDPASALRAE